MPDNHRDDRLSESHADVGARRGGVRLLIIVAVVAALILLAFGIFGRRSGEGKQQATTGTAAVLTPGDRALA